MRRLTIPFAAALALATAVTAAAAEEPRLDGAFKVTATVRDNDFGIDEGTKTKETFIFEASCAQGACRKVKLTRKDPGGTYKSTLKQTDRGAYKGSEGPYPYPSCPDNDQATFTAHHTVRAKRADGDGQATAIGGRTKIEFAGCERYSLIKYRLKGELE